MNLQMGKSPRRAHKKGNRCILLALKIISFWSWGGEEDFVNCEVLLGEINGSGGCALPDPVSLRGSRVGGSLEKDVLGSRVSQRQAAAEYAEARRAHSSL